MVEKGGRIRDKGIEGREGSWRMLGRGEGEGGGSGIGNNLVPNQCHEVDAVVCSNIY